jgi:protoheme IX farnesyltransferase
MTKISKNPTKFQAYYYLTKPGIIRGNLFTAAAGILLAAKGHINIGLFLATLGGIGLVIAAACVFNNYMDRKVDKKMARTKTRALVTGQISGRNALVFGTVLGFLGFSLLILKTNILTVFLGVLAIVSYVFLYGYAKRKSVHGTLVGTFPGALPPVAGYTAVSSQLDTAALILFFMLVFWQMAHFYAIAIFRRADYRAAGIPVRPSVRGVESTQIQILWFIAAFIAVSLLMTAAGYTGYSYTVVVMLVSGTWLYKGIKTLKLDQTRWAKQMFGYSLLVLTSVSLVLCFESFLP